MIKFRDVEELTEEAKPPAIVITKATTDYIVLCELYDAYKEVYLTAGCA